MDCEDLFSHRGVLTKVLLNAAPWVWLGSALFSAVAYFPSASLVAFHQHSFALVCPKVGYFKISDFGLLEHRSSGDGVTGTCRTFFSLSSSTCTTSRELCHPDKSGPNSRNCPRLCDTINYLFVWLFFLLYDTTTIPKPFNAPTFGPLRHLNGQKMV